MAKPVEDKDNQNPNKKIPFEMSPNVMMILNNVVMIVIIIIAMTIMYVLLDSSFNKKIAKLLPADEQSEIDDDEEDVKQEGVLLDLGEFILNLADVSSRRYLKIGIAMELSKTPQEMAASQVKDTKSQGHGQSAIPDNSAMIIAEMEHYKPAIRDAIISVLSNKTSDELSTPTGKEIAKEEILEMVNGIFAGQREVLRVSFGQFIIQ